MEKPTILTKQTPSIMILIALNVSDVDLIVKANPFFVCEVLKPFLIFSNYLCLGIFSIVSIVSIAFYILFELALFVCVCEFMTAKRPRLKLFKLTILI